MVRFTGAERSKGKLKALSEPILWGEYRLYHAPRGALWKGIGGAILKSFPAIRADVSRTMSAFSILEILGAISPLHSPSPAKYALGLSALEALEAGPAPWTETAFALRLLAAAGLGFPSRPAECASKQLWEALLEQPFAGLRSIPYDTGTDAALKGLIQEQVEAQSEQPLRAWGVKKRLTLFVGQQEPGARGEAPADACPAPPTLTL